MLPSAWTHAHLLLQSNYSTHSDRTVGVGARFTRPWDVIYLWFRRSSQPCRNWEECCGCQLQQRCWVIVEACDEETEQHSGSWICEGCSAQTTTWLPGTSAKRHRSEFTGFTQMIITWKTRRKRKQQQRVSIIHRKYIRGNEFQIKTIKLKKISYRMFSYNTR